MGKRIYLIDINPGITILGTPPAGEVNTAYSFTFNADGGTSPYTWAIISGSLPDGLSLNQSTGEISGTPTTEETASFTVEATDATGATATRESTISVAQANLFEGWSHYVEFTVAAGNVSSELTDFPAYIDLSDLPSGAWAEIKSDGSDLRAAKSDGTEIPMELVEIDTTAETGEVHAKMPTCDVGEAVRLYFGNSSATAPANGSTYGRNAVWSEYGAVWHFSESPASGATDSTGNGHDLTSQGTNSLSSSGKIGSCWDLGGTDGVDYASNDDDIVTTESLLQNLTFQGWVQGGGGPKILGGQRGSNEGFSATRELLTSTSLHFDAFIRRNGANYGVVNSSVTVSSISDWFIFHLAYDGANVRVFVNGGQTGSDDPLTGDMEFDTTTFGVGEVLAAFSSESWIGLVDEYRLGPARSADWIEAEYNNQSSPSSFWTVGSLQVNPDG